MKKKEIDRLRTRSLNELKQEAEKRSKRLVEAKFKLSQGKLNDVHLPNKLKKEIAVIKTIMTEKENKDE